MTDLEITERLCGSGITWHERPNGEFFAELNGVAVHLWGTGMPLNVSLRLEFGPRVHYISASHRSPDDVPMEKMKKALRSAFSVPEKEPSPGERIDVALCANMKAILDEALRQSKSRHESEEAFEAYKQKIRQEVGFQLVYGGMHPF